MVLCVLPFLVEATGIYIANSPAARAVLGITEPGAVMPREFFLVALTIQGFFAFFLTAWVAPILVSPDLVNGALPLYLARPFTKAEYVLGKTTVLLTLLSLITWVPGLILFSLQASLAGREWWVPNLRQAWAILAGAGVWIGLLSLLGLALSAWIRWRLVASGALAGLFFMGSAFGEIWREIIGNSWGRLANPTYLVGLVWRDLFGLTDKQALVREMLDDRAGRDLPVAVAWAALLVACVACAWILNRRLQAREVVS
jgi:ABC-2 type transport system permease protein